MLGDLRRTLRLVERRAAAGGRAQTQGQKYTLTLKRSRNSLVFQDVYFKRHWRGFGQAEAAIAVWDTGVDANLLTSIGEKSVNYPDSFVRSSQLMRLGAYTRSVSECASNDFKGAHHESPVQDSGRYQH